MSNNSMINLMKSLYPICRSITGDGLRETLSIIKQQLPALRIKEVKTGTKVLDWTVPEEWNIKEAWIKDSKGNKVIDFKDSNLHVVNYSVPVNEKLTLEQLMPHLYTDQANPKAIPYKTSYYKKDWGFCLAYDDYKKLKKGIYHVFIDSSLKNGSLTYGEFYIRGKVDEEVLITAHCCHPSLCNDNLSGLVVAVELAKKLQQSPNFYSYRILFIPGTIGSITWLSQNKKNVSKIKYGLVLTGVGDGGKIHYKKSRQGTAQIDKVAEYVLKTEKTDHDVLDFYPFGYDERQFCSPGFNLPVGSFMRTPFEQYKQYHTSLDNLSFINEKNLQESLDILIKILNVVDANQKYVNLYPFGEPQLGKRGLYEAMAGQTSDRKKLQLSFLWILNQSDGNNSLLDIAQKSNMSVEFLKNSVDILLKQKLIKEFTYEQKK